MTESAIAPRLTIEEIVRVYELAAADIRGSFARVCSAEQALNQTFARDAYGSVYVNTGSGVRFNDPEHTLLRIRHQVWACIIDRLEVRRMMSIARAKELDRQLEKHELPEITHENVAALLTGFESNLRAMLEEAVDEVFEWLRPHRSEYKTNTELEIGPRVVLTRIVERWDRLWRSWRVNYHVEPNLTALENVFSALDGRGQITKTHYSAISTVIKAPGFDGVGETEYFRFRVYQNGNGHLQFRRLDLLAKFNAIAGGKRLRPAAAAE